MTYCLVIDEQITELSEGVSFTVEGVQYPGNVTGMWTEAELAEIGVFPVTELPVGGTGEIILTADGYARSKPAPVMPEVDLETLKADKKRQINDTRDSKIDGGFTYDGNRYQSRSADRENLVGAALAAQIAISLGAQEGDLRWLTPGYDFVWIAADNNLVPMDAHDVLGLYSAGLAFKSGCIFAARTIKDMIDEAANDEDVYAAANSDIWPV